MTERKARSLASWLVSNRMSNVRMVVPFSALGPGESFVSFETPAGAKRTIRTEDEFRSFKDIDPCGGEA